MKNKIRDNRGITLIALVITIIVLLILAGVSIAMLTGENGILTKASSASEQTKQQGALEKVKIAVAGSWGNDGKINIEELRNNLNNVEGIDKSTIKDSLPMLVEVDGIDVNIESNGRINIINSDETGLPTTKDTIPYLPSNDFSKVDGTDLNTGLTIKDSNQNSYVWVEVSKSIYNNVTSNEDYSNIEKDMQAYAIDYRADKYGNTGTDQWYEGCGLTEIEYNNLKQTMLKSLYDNGGFWISQYEIGTDTPRTSSSDALTTPVSKEGAYPYNHVTISQAQQVARMMNSGNYNSSLMFGIQWDLTMKFIEEKAGKTAEQLKTDSTQWGSYFNTTFDITKGKYSTDAGKTYTEVNGSYKKPSESFVLLTTGSTQRNTSLNIYDLGGNVYEWTLEKSENNDRISRVRGGDYGSNGDVCPAAYRYHYTATLSYNSIGFRLALY